MSAHIRSLCTSSLEAVYVYEAVHVYEARGCGKDEDLDLRPMTTKEED